MTQVNVATAELPKLLELLETGQETRIVLERDGKPVARMEGCQDEPDGRHVIIGFAQGKLKYPADINAYDDEIAEMFGA